MEIQSEIGSLTMMKTSPVFIRCEKVKRNSDGNRQRCLSREYHISTNQNFDTTSFHFFLESFYYR